MNSPSTLSCFRQKNTYKDVDNLGVCYYTYWQKKLLEVILVTKGHLFSHYYFHDPETPVSLWPLGKNTPL